jgi:hypothetical protein
MKYNFWIYEIEFGLVIKDLKKNCYVAAVAMIHKMIYPDLTPY